jgi:molybdate transport system regulatory protein
MLVSTRNQLKGKIASIKEGAVNAEIVLQLTGSKQIVAVITDGSVKTMGLKEGTEAYALIKASSVILGVGIKEVSARNILCGKVSSISEGAVNTEVTVDLGDGFVVTSVITKTSAGNLGLAKGKEVCAIIKASSVIIAKA